MWGIFLECTEDILSVGDFKCVQKRYSVWGIFLECTEEILSVGEFLECREEILSVGDISRVYRRHPQCVGYF